ncbi:unnamed protein product [Rhizophagus irregularis]|nr:unnamed protein product [Rhizophagus irregularis]
MLSSVSYQQTVHYAISLILLMYGLNTKSNGIDFLSIALYQLDLEADVTNGFVEDSYDAKQILLKSMIAKVGEENIQELQDFKSKMVPSGWYINNQKNKDATAETCCFINKEAAQNFSDVILIPNPSTVPTTITNALHCAAKKKVKYGEEIAITRNQELMERSEVQVDDDKENEPQQVENLLVSRRKGRPETKQIEIVDVYSL